MRKVLFLILAVCIAFPCFAETTVTPSSEPIITKVTSDTVSFNTVARIVTFNTAIRKLLLENQSASYYVWVTVEGLGWNNERTKYFTPQTAGTVGNTLGSIRLMPNESLSLDIATKYIGYVAENEGTLMYIGTTSGDTRP